jgi:hypothetical protein
MDPGYSIDTAKGRSGRIIRKCRPGTWKVELLPEPEPKQQRWLVPRTLIAAEESAVLSNGRGRWRTLAKDIGSDGGVIGVYDLAHFQDGTVVAAGQKPLVESWSDDPAMLWYSMNCDAVQGKLASVVVHGAVVHWDGGLDVAVRESRHEIVGVRLSISGWPDRI